MPAVESSVVYVSDAISEFDDTKLAELASFANERNCELSVTGYLYYARGRFVQYLEGEHQLVEGLLGRIQRDERHRILATLHESELVERRFPNWGMRWVRQHEIVEIGLESLLTDHVIFCAESQLSGNLIDNTVRRMVDAIADLNSRQNELKKLGREDRSSGSRLQRSPD